MKNKTVYPLITLTMIVASYPSYADENFYETEPQLIDEITTWGSMSGFGGWGSALSEWMGSYWQFGVVDTQDVFGSGNSFTQILGNALDQLNDASDALCAQKIDQWRNNCHTQMDIAGATCGLTGFFATGTAVTSLLPSFLRGATAGAGIFVTGIGCYGFTTRAHQYCDLIADSERAVDVAQCDQP